MVLQKNINNGEKSFGTEIGPKIGIYLERVVPPCWFYFLILYLKLWYWKCQCPTYSSSADDYVQSLTFPSGLRMSRVGRLFCGRWNCCPRPGTRVRFTWSHRSTQTYRTHSTSWRGTTGNCSTSAGSTFHWHTHRWIFSTEYRVLYRA